MPQTAIPPKPLANRNMHIVFCVSLLAILGVVSITPAFPAIQQAFQLSDAGVGMLITVFTLPGALLSPVMGMLADRYGRKTILVPSLILFGLAGISCGLAATLGQLLALRFVQGIGAAALGALNLTIIGDMYDGKMRSTAMGFNAAVITMGIVTYPALGGFLATLSWRAPFVLPALAFPVAALAAFKLNAPEPRSTISLGRYLAGAFRGLKQLQVLVLFLAMAGTSLIMFGVIMHYLTLRLATHFQATMLQIGLLYAGPAFAAGVAASQLGRLTRMIDERRLIIASFACYALACGLTPLMPGLWYHFIPFTFLGVAQGLSMPCIQSVLAGMAPMGHRAGFMTLSGMSMRMGQTLGPVVMTFVAAMFGPVAVYPAGSLLALAVMALLLAAFRKGLRSPQA